MNEKLVGQNIVNYRKEMGLTQEELAERLHISPQAISKWENGHSLPETALLPALAQVLGIDINRLFDASTLTLTKALYGDGLDAINVTKRLNRMVDNDMLTLTVNAAVLGVATVGERAAFLTLHYKTPHGDCYAAYGEGQSVLLTAEDTPTQLPIDGLTIVAGCYGTRRHHCDIMHKIEHYQVFNWAQYRADHEVFPSNPANDGTEYLTLVYLNAAGIHMVTCAEGESLAYVNQCTELTRRAAETHCYLPNAPKLPPFGSGMECSWAAALTGALQAMGVNTTYEEVMGVSGACWRLAFCSPGWDYSSVDGLVAYDYATPGFAAYGYTREMYGRIDKEERAAHRARIASELRNGMPVLGINLRRAAEWGYIGGYEEDGELLLCRTKYEYQPPDGLNKPHDYEPVENWPFLLCYFTNERKAPSAKENFLSSLRILVDCAEQPNRGYYVGLEAYAVWAADLRDDAFYQSCDDEQHARRFSVDQFCTLALTDARHAAYAYLRGVSTWLDDAMLGKLIDCYRAVAERAQEIHSMLDSGEYLEGARSRAFWTVAKRHKQAALLDEMAQLERQALAYAKTVLDQYHE